MIANEPKWLSAHLYYAEPWEPFLLNAIGPFTDSMKNAGLIEQFFFIRYYDRGPHIRLRLKGQADILNSEVQPKLIKYFNEYFYQHPSIRNETEAVKWFPNHSIQLFVYEPELERYGGLTGMTIAEKQFELSSQTIMDLLKQKTDWNYDNAIGAAILLHTALVYAFGMNQSEAIIFFKKAFSDWFTRAYNPSGLDDGRNKELKIFVLRAFRNQYMQQKTVILRLHHGLWDGLNDNYSFEDTWLRKWIEGIIVIAGQINQAYESGELILKGKPADPTRKSEIQNRNLLWPILCSYLHMTNNRLGVLNRDEAYLSYIIKNSFEDFNS